MDDNDKRQMLRLGVPAHQLKSAAKAKAPQAKGIRVARHLWPAVSLFRALQTQWIMVALPTGGLYVVGMNNAVIAPTMALLGMSMTNSPRLLSYLQIMESEAKAVLNEVAKA